MSDMLMTPVVHDKSTLDRVHRHARAQNIVLPTFAQLASPHDLPEETHRALAAIPADEPHPLNLFRINWFNAHGGSGLVAQPPYLEVPSSLSGVKARIVVVLGDSFPHDRRAQGARRLCLPGNASCNRPLRSAGKQGNLAVNGKLLPWWYRHIPNSGVQGRRCPAGANEPGAVQLA